MQRTRLNGRQIVLTVILPFLAMILLILSDQIVKGLFNFKIGMGKEITVVKNLFTLIGVYNDGAAYGTFGGTSWAQTFFICLTSVALCIFFVFFFMLPLHKNLLRWSLTLIISGTIGNFIDRIAYRKVVDMFCLTINGNAIFGIFNVADVLLCVGIALVVFNYLFIDEEALFRSKESKEKAKAKIQEKYYGGSKENE